MLREGDSARRAAREWREAVEGGQQQTLYMRRVRYSPFFFGFAIFPMFALDRYARRVRLWIPVFCSACLKAEAAVSPQSLSLFQAPSALLHMAFKPTSLLCD